MATAYQLFRFTLLFFSILLVLQGTAALGAINLVLALGAPALVVILILVRLGFGGASLLLPPVRVAGAIQLVTAIAMLFHALRAPLPLIPALPGAIPLMASIFVVGDFAFLVFLLIYNTSTEDS